MIVQTFDSLDGQDVKTRALEDAKASKVHGLYFLISKHDQKFRIVPSESAKRVFSQEMITVLSAALTEAFKQGRFDQGLLGAAARIKTTATGATLAGSKPTAEAPVPPPATVVNKGGSPRVGKLGMPEVLFVGVGALALLWLLGKTLRRPRPQAVQPETEYARAGVPPHESPGPGVRPAGPFGGPGNGPGPRPGYPRQQGSHGPPPLQQGGGGGFMSGILGGLGGAVVGNILYDKFGRPHSAAPQQGGEGSYAEHDLPEAPIPPPIHDDPATPLPIVKTYHPDSDGSDCNESAATPDPTDGGDWGGPLSDTVGNRVEDGDGGDCGYSDGGVDGRGGGEWWI